MSQLDTPFSVLSCRNCFDFVDMLVLKCFFFVMLYTGFFIYEFIFNLFDGKFRYSIFLLLP